MKRAKSFYFSGGFGPCHDCSECLRLKQICSGARKQRRRNVAFTLWVHFTFLWWENDAVRQLFMLNEILLQFQFPSTVWLCPQLKSAALHLNYTQCRWSTAFSSWITVCPNLSKLLAHLRFTFSLSHVSFGLYLSAASEVPRTNKPWSFSLMVPSAVHHLVYLLYFIDLYSTLHRTKTT